MATVKATQEFVAIKKIRDGVAVLKDGSLCIVLMASTLNFALKSEDEQNATIMQFQNFLNSLDFPIQFFIESRKLNINPYLISLEKAGREQPNELLKIQIREYIEFIKNFVKSTNIVTKTFYVIASYKPSMFGTKKGLLEDLFGAKNNVKGHEIEKGFEEARLQLQQRADVISQGLVRAGIRMVPLGTEELIELFYKLFNPGELERDVAGQVKEEM